MSRSYFLNNQPYKRSYIVIFNAINFIKKQVIQETLIYLEHWFVLIKLNLSVSKHDLLVIINSEFFIIIF